MTHPEQTVLDAIAGLEADEIGERVRWQLEEGMKRGDHLPIPPHLEEIADILAEFATGIPNFSEVVEAMLEPIRRRNEAVAIPVISSPCRAFIAGGLV